MFQFTICQQKQASLKAEEFERETYSLDYGMYMDDLTSGGDTPEEAISRSVNMKLILDEAKLPLVKWVTSSKKVSKKLRSLDFHMREESDENLPIVKILGLNWDPGKDTITWIYMLCTRGVKLDVFCNASPKGYGCAIYVVLPDDKRELVIAKSRVAPAGVLTLSKLELTAALLGVRLSKYFKRKLSFRIYYSDSQVALSWITTEKNTWKPYVTNCVHEILEGSKIDQWYYVSTENNPADIATRTDKIKELIIGNLWRNGPKCLKNEKFIETKHEETKEEMKIAKEATFQMIHNDGFFEMVVGRFSEWNKLIRTLAYMRRFHSRFKGEISVQEIKSTEDFVIKLSQEIYF
uniref:Uncharacterized protein n=1 Tax=Strigamia maritima TaxID=126957 RepID=T1IJG2_STRMM